MLRGATTKAASSFRGGVLCRRRTHHRAVNHHHHHHHQHRVYAAATEEERTTRDMIDLRVGKVTKCEVHPDADKLYVEEIDLREPEGPRTICSGLRRLMHAEDIWARM